jgi:vacuolar-type H+-ATPase subunit E/Vma4
MAEDNHMPNSHLRRDGTITLQEHWESLEAANEKFMAERDRRYSEVNIEREKALKIKEEADKAALGLAREIQSYKDEKANQLREQISSERGSYATKDDLSAMVRELTASIQPLSTYVAGMAGKSQESSDRLNVSRERSEAVSAKSGGQVMIIAVLALITSIIMPLIIRLIGH